MVGDGEEGRRKGNGEAYMMEVLESGISCEGNEEVGWT